MINVDTSGLPGSYPVTIFETWKQPNGTPNQLYSGSNNYYIVVGGSGSNSPIIWYIIIVVAIVLLATYFAAKQAMARKSKR